MRGPADGQVRLLSVLFLGVLMAALDVAIVGPALPAIGSSFGVDARALAWVFSTYVLFGLIGSTLLARLSDAYGRRTLYVASVALFAAGSLAVALSRSFSVLLAGRAVQGFGAGGIVPVATATVGDAFPPERRGRALGFLGMVFGVAFILGPLLGAILLRFGWPFLFLVNLPLAAAVVGWGWRLLPRGRAGGRLEFDLPGVLLLSGGLALFALGMSSVGWPRPPLPPGLAVAGAAALLALFWKAEQAAAQPVVDPALLRQSQLLIAYALSVVAGCVEAGFMFIPSLVVRAFHLPPADASLVLLPAVLAVAVGAPVSGHLLDRHGSRRVVLAGAGLLGVGLLLLNGSTGALGLFLANGVVIGLGLASLIGAPLRYIVLNAAGAEHRGVAQAVSSVFRSVGHLTGGPLVGAIIASHPSALSGYHLAYSLLAALVFAGAVLALGLRHRQAERAAAT